MKTVKLTDEAYRIILDILWHNYIDTKIEREAVYNLGDENRVYELEQLAQQEKEALRLYEEFLYK